MTMEQGLQVDLSIIIKTLNEERNIQCCIESILNNLSDVKFEIIIADSGSVDRTVDIAEKYPVTIVQLANPEEKSCGIGPQLGYQHSRGQFILILDADMVLHASFIHNALAKMKIDSRCGGIGGQLVECSGTGYEYELQQRLNSVQQTEVNWLNGCALYRREAICSVGYLSNRNLHAYEEKELGLRLKHAGWHLYRLPDVAVDHYGHTIDTVKLLWRRWQTGYADACGESIRACFGKPYFLDMVSVHKSVIVTLMLQLGFVFGLLLLVFSPLFLYFFGILWVVSFVVQLVRKKTINNTLHSFLHLNVFAVGLARGVLKRQVNPIISIDSVVRKTVF